jgi:short-subunit dehydrogenase
MEITRGMTALVTGASSGIGEAIAHKLAGEGMDLLLVARSEVKLQALAARLTADHGVHATALAADLSKAGCGKALLSWAEANGVAVDVLVNNAGFGTYGAFDTIAADADQTMIAVNAGAVIDLTHAFLPGMLERRRGAVLNIASAAAFQPGAYMAVYAASKAFVLSFSEALWVECRGRGVHVAALCPGAVETQFIDKLGGNAVRKTPVFSATLRADHVADQAIRALRGTAPTRIVGAKYWFLAQSARFAPRSVVARIGARQYQPRGSKTHGKAKRAHGPDSG